MQITDNVYAVPDVVCNTYVIVDADGLTLIDSGLPRADKKILAYVASLGKSAGDIERIVLTHSDLDHVGGLFALHNASGARTFASAIEAEAIAKGEASRVIKPKNPTLRMRLFALLRPFFKAKPFRVDEIIKAGQTLPALGGLEVIETPGHTPGHISLYSRSANLLFCGDSMVSEDGILLPSRAPLTWDNARAAESVRKQAALNARIVCSGHGPVVMDAVGKYPRV